MVITSHSIFKGGFMQREEIFLGFDVHSKTNMCHFLHSEGTKAHPPLEFEQDTNGFGKLRKVCEKLVQKWPDAILKCGIEATGPYWFALGAFLQSLPWKVEITAINPCTIKNFKKIELKRVKTDPVDARMIAKYMIRFRPSPTPYFTDKHIELRQLARGREFFVKQRSATLNQLRSLLAIVFPEISRRETSMNATIFGVLEHFPSPDLLKHATDKQLRELRHQHSGRRIAFVKTSSLRSLADKSIGIPVNQLTRSYIVQLVQQIRFLDEQIKKAEEQLTRYYMQHFASSKIHTITGIGPVSSAIIMSEIVHPDRFECCSDWIGFIGLYPEWKWSADLQDYAAKMTKKGNKYLRYILYNCCLSSLSCNPVVRKHYHNQLSRRKRKMVAIGSCMRKLASIIFGVMKTQQDFDPLYEFKTKKK
jgi:transposase